MKTILVFLTIFATLYGCQNVRAEEAVSKFDTTLSHPVELTTEELALSNEDVLIENWNKPKVAYASDYGQLPSNASPFSGEVTISSRKSSNTSGAVHLTTTQLYAEYVLDENVSLWGTLYHDKTFESAYIGLAKKYGNWQVALGAGNAWYDGTRHTLVNPWVYYDSGEYEGLVTVEYYVGDTEDPWWYKSYIERKFNGLGIGLYGEKNVGLGPRVSYKIGKRTKVWAIRPIVNRPNEGGMGFLVGITLVF